jgi:hypothetical protein
LHPLGAACGCQEFFMAYEVLAFHASPPMWCIGAEYGAPAP